MIATLLTYPMIYRLPGSVTKNIFREKIPWTIAHGFFRIFDDFFELDFMIAKIGEKSEV